MKTNIFTYSNGAKIPGYISINEEADERVTITLRNTGAPFPSHIELPRDELATMAAAIGIYLEATAPIAIKVKK